MISVLILTYNEAVNVEPCIAALPWRDDVCVLDSLSSDGTQEIATKIGARVVERRFTTYADQRNFGLALDFRHDWIVMLDADERMTPALAAEIERRVTMAGDGVSMFRVRRRDMFMGRWLRRSSGYPTWFPRVMRRGRVTVERAVNEHYTTTGGVEQLQEHLIHYPFNKGMDWWFERHNRYSTTEAALMTAAPAASQGILRGLLARDPTLRRAALKAAAYRLPGRPFLVFLYLYVVRLGLLDGQPGYQFASMRMAYEIMIDAKAAAMRSAAAGAGIDDGR